MANALEIPRTNNTARAAKRGWKLLKKKIKKGHFFKYVSIYLYYSINLKPLQLDGTDTAAEEGVKI